VLARFYITANRPADAENEYKSVISSGDLDGSATRELVLFYLNQGKPQEGRKLVDKVLKESPNDPAALVLRGRMEMLDNKLNDSVDDFQHALKSDPDLTPAYLYLSQTFMAQGNQQQAVAALNEALRRDPKNSMARLQLAKEELKGGPVDDAMSDLQKVLSGPQIDLTPSLLMAQAMVSKQQYDEADKFLQQLVDQVKSPGPQSLIYNTWAELKLAEHKPKDARKYVLEAMKLAPQVGQNVVVLARTYQATKEYPAGIQQIRAILQKYPDWADVYNIGGTLAMEGKDFPTAEQWLKKANELSPNDLRYKRGLAELALAEQKPEVARDMYSKLAAAHPEDIASNMRAAELFEDVDWPKAEGLYKHCLDLDPNNALAKNNLAFAYLTHQGNPDVALKLAQEAKQSFPHDPAINDTLAWAYIQKGSYNEAVEFLKQSLQTFPDQPNYNYHLAFAYAKLGDKTEAKKALTIAMKAPSFVSSKEGNDAKQLMSTLN
jgi:tetratricopeptide (TPR) repeat protein